MCFVYNKFIKLYKQKFERSAPFWQFNMNITIFGANSSIGKYLIDLFVNDNHNVTAFIDKPGSIKFHQKTKFNSRTCI